jgi:hypothetical protein
MIEITIFSPLVSRHQNGKRLKEVEGTTAATRRPLFPRHHWLPLHLHRRSR